MRKLLDVVVDDAFLLDLTKLLAAYRNAPVTDLAIHSVVAAMEYEKRLKKETVQHVLLLLERRRADCIDLELNDRVDQLKIAHDAMHERLARRDAERGESLL